jgi:hypothetical protein
MAVEKGCAFVMLGFETIGSAIVIVYDDGPVLCTDPWINSDAYFGSWGHDFEIPSEQLFSIRKAKNHWFSHGHPDHLNVVSLPELSAGRFLIADHFGGRIERDLLSQGYSVRVLKDFEWVQISPNVKVLCIANANQDSCLLIDVGGTLIINLNDAPDLGWSRFIRQIAKQYDKSFLLTLSSWSGADMANFLKPDGRRLYTAESFRHPIAPRYQAAAAKFGARFVIPFSSFHRYQRSDSVWANELVLQLADYYTGADPKRATILDPFVRVNAVSGEVTSLRPQKKTLEVVQPEAFGDSWSDQLNSDDVKLLAAYFRSKQVLSDHFGFINVRVGGREHTIDLNPQLRMKGITFEVPRSSLMTSIKHEVFDDLLIGNFMKTTLHGVESLYPNFSPIVAKYGDNGGVRSREQLNAYFRHYRARDPVGYWFGWAEKKAESIFRRAVSQDSALFKSAKNFYYGARRLE